MSATHILAAQIPLFTPKSKPTFARRITEQEWMPTWRAQLVLGLPADGISGLKTGIAWLKGQFKVKEARFEILARLKEITRGMHPDRVIGGKFISSPSPDQSCIHVLLKHDLHVSDIQNAKLPAAILAP